MRRATAFACVVLVFSLFHAIQSLADDTVNVVAVVQATKTAVTKGRVVPGATFTVDHMSIANDVFALAQWSWGQGAGQVIFINDGKPGMPQWTVIGGGGGMIDAKGLQSDYGVDPPYNVPLVNNMLRCPPADQQPIVSGMDPKGTACSQRVAAPDYGAPKDSGPASDVAAARQATLAAGKTRGWRISLSNVYLVVVRDDYAVGNVGYKGAIGAVLAKTNGTWRVLNWNAVWGGGDPTKNQLIASGARPSTAAALATALTPHESPWTQGWNKHNRAGNIAASADDLAGAIQEYQRADAYARDKCMHEIVRVNLKAAKETMALVKAGSLTADQSGDAYWKLHTKYWMVDPCNGP